MNIVRKICNQVRTDFRPANVCQIFFRLQIFVAQFFVAHFFRFYFFSSVHFFRPFIFRLVLLRFNTCHGLYGLWTLGCQRCRGVTITGVTRHRSSVTFWAVGTVPSEAPLCTSYIIFSLKCKPNYETWAPIMTKSKSLKMHMPLFWLNEPTYWG